MKISHQSFYSHFYGEEFARYFRRIPYSQNTNIRKQFIIETPQKLWHRTYEVKGMYPAYTSIYNYGSIDALKHNNKKNIIFDRVFFDFDVSNENINNLKGQLSDLRSKGLKNNIQEQRNLVNQIRDQIIDEKVAKPAYDDCLQFYKLLENEIGTPSLFFSGCKGCHAYVFFGPVKLIEPNKTITYFAETIKEKFNLNTMDLSVNKDATSRISRVPYSQHQLTGLTVVPFNASDSYNKMIKKAIDPYVEHFNLENHLTTLSSHLVKIDQIIVKNSKIEAINSRKNNIRKSNNYISNMNQEDNRIPFKKFLGEPEHSYEHYDMYNCPFPDHQDLKPSFQVSKIRYICRGCNRSGNYLQFIKEIKQN